ncbi:Uncharacterized protein Adt_39314 [Abeliophyllum distichum]|uniref:Retrovirus-related Pol polyprotein from transposon TNT 1-94-like beta-barrel domain-containing protein n=1 Tax=Abeliophyllum distichum TaxID=126358 RepID=A0ABD1Q4Q8_9LAMI
MNVEELIVRLRIEEDNKSSERWFNPVVAKANVVEHGQSSKINKEQEMFSGFEEVDGEKLYMENSATSEIKGHGKVVLKMTSGKELTLNNVLYVPRDSQEFGVRLAVEQTWISYGV